MEMITLEHGSGGSLMHELIRGHFGPAFDMAGFGDSAILDMGGQRLAFTTDSYVVSPLFFSGGNIGELAVYGTVNDLCVSGARPLFLSAGFIIEEGFLLDDLKNIVKSMSAASERAGVRIVTGDTKVVNKGKGDGLFINTAGVGLVPDGRDISPKRITNGDKILISGEAGSHGISIMARRSGITFEPPILSDAAPLNSLVEDMFRVTKDIHFMRDPTRGGLATTLKEAAVESGKCLYIMEDSIPVAPQVRGACEILGFDPLYAANEGKLVAIVGADVAEPLAEAMRLHPLGENSRIIGEVTLSPNGTVLLETPIGGTRIMEMLRGEQLPRIC